MSQRVPTPRRKRDRLQSLLAWTHSQPHESSVRLANKGEDDLSANEPESANSMIPLGVTSSVSQDRCQSREIREIYGLNTLSFLVIPERSSSYKATGERRKAALRTAT